MPAPSLQGSVQIQCKRAYDTPGADDGYRLLVDKLWPRGVSKAQLRLDEWDKSLAPSDALRRWFNHEPEKWAAFYQKYHKQLRQTLPGSRVDTLLEHARHTGLTLLYAAKDPRHNNAVALRMFLESFCHN